MNTPGRFGLKIGLALGLAWALAGCGSEPTPPIRRAGAGPFELVDVAAASGIAVVQTGGGADVDHIIDSLGAGAAWLDYDGDGDPDLYLAQGATEAAPSGPPDRLWRNDGDIDGDGNPDFTDVTEEAGLGDTRWTFGVAAADYDNDGDTDLYLANWGANRLYRNNGDGTFTDVAVAAGVADTAWGVSAVFSDVDRDGDLDLYLVNYVEFDFDRYPARGEPGRRGEPPCNWRGVEVFCGPRNLEPATNVLYRNDGDEDGDGVPHFEDVTGQFGLVTAPLFGLAAHFFDADDDGDDDLYVANDSVQNTYFVNRGDGTFEETAILAGLAYNEQGYEQAGMGITSADFDGDGRIDVAVTNFSHDHDTLYRNEGDHYFSDVSYPAGIGTPSYLGLGWGISFLDLDLDGWEDLFVARGHVYPQIDGLSSGTTFRQQNNVYRNLADGTFADVTGEAGSGVEIVRSSRVLLPVDLEGDGDIDLLVTSLNDAPVLLRNDALPRNWLAVRLVGRQSNRDGIGAKVTLEAGGRRQIREIRSNASYAGATLPVAHFGLLEVDRIDRLEVRWPSGRTTVSEGVSPNRLLVLEEPR